MNRIQNKCLIASTLMHGLLLLAMVVGTAFLNSNQKPVESPRIITLQNFTVTDDKTHGGSPAPVAAAPVAVPEKPVPAPPAEPVQAKSAPPEREPEPPKPVVEPPKAKPVEPKETVSELPVTKPTKKTLPKPEPDPKTTEKSSTKPAPIKREIDLGKPVVRNSKEKQQAAKAAEAADRAEQQRATAQRVAAINGSLKNLGKNLSTSTTVEMPEGLGGAAEINYRDLVLKKYDDAWNAPGDVDDDEANTKVRVVIARSGNVISADIIQNSRNSKLDKSVRRALDSLRFIHPFPAGSTDSQRTYIINFNLKAKRGIG